MLRRIVADTIPAIIGFSDGIVIRASLLVREGTKIYVRSSRNCFSGDRIRICKVIAVCCVCPAVEGFRGLNRCLLNISAKQCGLHSFAHSISYNYHICNVSDCIYISKTTFALYMRYMHSICSFCVKQSQLIQDPTLLFCFGCFCYNN